MRIKKILAIVMVAIMLVGCGGVESKPQTSEKKEEKMEAVVKDIAESGGEDESHKDTTEGAVEEETAEPVPAESIASPETQKTEKKSQKTETKKNTETVAPVVTTPVVSESVATPEQEVKECEHWYQPEFNGYEIIEHYSFACNGCGYQLCTLQICTDSNNESRIDAVNLPDLYSHPACETERFEGLCDGGGFHSHWFTNARCAFCHGNILKISCFFSETGKMCMKNEESLGPYEKIEDGQNPTVYLESCDCGKNSIFVGKVLEASPHSGLLFLKETCMYCGHTKTYPEK